MIKSFKTYISESINDKYLFKSIIIAGGPGSGKTMISKKMFSGLGVQFVNSDTFFEKFLKDYDFPKKIEKNDPREEQRNILRDWAKEFANNQWGKWVNGMLPIVIDGTGKDYDKIEKQYKKLKNIGYDCWMIFVNTNIETAKKRNKERYGRGGRYLDDEMLKDFWNKAQDNIGKFQELFDDDMYIIDNNKELKDDELHDFIRKMHNKALKILEKPLENKIGLDILEKLEDKKKSYIDELDLEDFEDLIKKII